MSVEADIINRFFKKKTSAPLGIGDDAALINKNTKEYWALSQDTLNVNTHFLPSTPALDLGWKALAVNVSDIYAMGGQPKYALVSIAINKYNMPWLEDFSRGLHQCAKKYGVEIICGDTTRGQTSISITIIGSVEKKKVLKRSGAKLHDDIWITGQIGLAALGLDCLKKKITLSEAAAKLAIKCLYKPSPTDIQSLQKYQLFHSAIDISDGVIADLSHILTSSNLSANIFCAQLPVSAWIKKEKAFDYALYGGDDYQLILTAPVKNRNRIKKLAAQKRLKITHVGQVTNEKKMMVFDPNGRPMKIVNKGFKHFVK